MMDEDRFVLEVTAMRDMLYRLSVSYLHSDADAQDAVQQAVENAWKHRQKVDGERFRPWLTRIVINECRTLLRRRKRVFASEQLERLACETPPPDLALADALSRLPEKMRTPLLLHYMEGFSVRETANALRMTETAVRSRLFRARAALRDALSGEEERVCESGRR